MADSDETLFPPLESNLNQSANWLVGVIDDPQQAAATEHELLQADFPRESVLLLQGDEALERLRAKDEHLGPLGWLMKTLAGVVTDGSGFEETYTAEAQAGHAIINLQVSEQDQIERARQIMVAHGGHYIKHFGNWVITRLG